MLFYLLWPGCRDVLPQAWGSRILQLSSHIAILGYGAYAGQYTLCSPGDIPFCFLLYCFSGFQMKLTATQVKGKLQESYALSVILNFLAFKCVSKRIISRNTLGITAGEAQAMTCYLF